MMQQINYNSNRDEKMPCDTLKIQRKMQIPIPVTVQIKLNVNVLKLSNKKQIVRLDFK